MIDIGRTNQLAVVERVVDGVILDAGRFGEVLLPSREITGDLNAGDSAAVFLYSNSDDQVIATTVVPNAVVGDCLPMKVISVGRFGAFLDWGLPKDLLLPLSEQTYPVTEGQTCVVFVYKDEHSDRIVATTRLHRFFEESSGPYKTGDRVELMIAAPSEMGFKAVIEGKYLGLIYREELSQPLRVGEIRPGWIKGIRDDGKVDLSVTRLDEQARDELSEAILQHLHKNGGRAELCDKSPPELIYRLFGASKKNFKRAISGLYKQRKIQIHAEFIERV